MEAILEALAAAVGPAIFNALTKGASRDDVMKTIEASMVAASDAAMLAELGPDAPAAP